MKFPSDNKSAAETLDETIPGIWNLIENRVFECDSCILWFISLVAVADPYCILESLNSSLPETDLLQNQFHTHKINLTLQFLHQKYNLHLFLYRVLHYKCKRRKWISMLLFIYMVSEWRDDRWLGKRFQLDNRKATSKINKWVVCQVKRKKTSKSHALYTSGRSNFSWYLPSLKFFEDANRKKNSRLMNSNVFMFFNKIYKTWERT